MATRLTEADISAFRVRLEARRDELLGLEQSTAESRQPVALDQQAVGRLSRMDAMQVQAMALATDRRRQAELARIQAALDRADEGEFGLCVRCDEPVAARRLEFDPTIDTCIRCAEEAG